MSIKQSNNIEIIQSELELALHAEQHHGAYYRHASNVGELLAQFVKSVRPDRFVFVMFLSSLRKHHMLALLSAVRLHHVQAMLNLRWTIEAAASAAYAIEHTDPDDFAKTNDLGMLGGSKNLAGKQYKWLDEKFPDGSQALKNLKEQINSSASHANLVQTHRTFQTNPEQQLFETAFFDKEDDYLTQTDLWQIANVGISILNLFSNVNSGPKPLVFRDDFVTHLNELSSESARLRSEMMQHERFRKIEALMSGANGGSGAANI
jgi:hypothetical protein